jgi:hypothetical protein
VPGGRSGHAELDGIRQVDFPDLLADGDHFGDLRGAVSGVWIEHVFDGVPDAIVPVPHGVRIHGASIVAPH